LDCKTVNATTLYGRICGPCDTREDYPKIREKGPRFERVIRTVLVTFDEVAGVVGMIEKGPLYPFLI